MFGQPWPSNKVLRVVTFVQEPFVYHNTKSEYSGICIKILRQLSKDLGFEFNITESDDAHYGIETNGEWSGLIGALHRNEADMAVQTISVTEERSGVVNFTAPFMMSGISAMMEATERTGQGKSRESLLTMLIESSRLLQDSLTINCQRRTQQNADIFQEIAKWDCKECLH